MPRRIKAQSVKNVSHPLVCNGHNFQGARYVSNAPALLPLSYFARENAYPRSTVKGSDPQEAYWNEDGLVMHNQIYRNQMFHEDDRVWEINDAEGNVFRVSQASKHGYRFLAFLKPRAFSFLAERWLR